MEALCANAHDAQRFSALCANVRKRLWVEQRLLTPACCLLPHTPLEALERLSALL